MNMPILQQGASGTTLTETITANAFWDIKYNWTISKTVSPERLDLFTNDTGTAQFTVTVTSDAGTEEAYITGEVCITNGGGVTTTGLQSTLILESPINTEILRQALDVSAMPNLAPGQTFCYPYRINFPLNKFVTGQSFRVTADTTITNHSGHSEPFGPNEKASGTLPSARSEINASINVNDTNGFSFVFNQSDPDALKTVTYSINYSCRSGQGAHTNTATIFQTGQSASATVVVFCYDLLVEKTAQTSFTRYYFWSIRKRAIDSNGVEVSSLTLGLNESFTVTYLIDVTRSFRDSDFMVSGTITVQNPNLSKDAHVLISDMILPDGIPATVSPSDVFVPAGASITVNYNALLPNNLSRHDQATVLLFNTPSGTTTYQSLSIPFDFSQAVIKEVDACAYVMDSFHGMLLPSPICSSFQFSYERTFGPYTSCNGTLLFPNTATFTTADTGIAGSADWSIAVTVPCSGCTLTIGYWKTHAGFSPQPDVVTPLLPVYLGTQLGALTVTVATAAQAVSILSFYGSNNVFDAANGINRLYAQLLAAKLNIKSGANDSVVASVITSADLFLATHNSTSWFTLNRATRNLVNSWQTTLDNYNNGLIGPGHCSEVTGSGTAALTATQAGDSETPVTTCTACAATADAASVAAEPVEAAEFEDSYAEPSYAEDSSAENSYTAGSYEEYTGSRPYQSVYYPYKQKHYWCDYYSNMWQSGR